MCFSAEVSFTAAGVLGALGAVCIGQASRLREKPLAAIPLLFAAQQALEGFIWLSPLHGGHVGFLLRHGKTGRVDWMPARVLRFFDDVLGRQANAEDAHG